MKKKLQGVLKKIFKNILGEPLDEDQQDTCNEDEDSNKGFDFAEIFILQV